MPAPLLKHYGKTLRYGSLLKYRKGRGVKQSDTPVRTAMGEVIVDRFLRTDWKLSALLDPLEARQETHCDEIGRSGKGWTIGERSWLVGAMENA